MAESEATPLGVNLLFFVLSITFTLLFQREHGIKCFVLPLQKTASRLFLLAPIYTLFIFLTGYVTELKGLWDILVAVMDGYALYTFFALLVYGAGGVALVQEKLSSAGRSPTVVNSGSALTAHVTAPTPEEQRQEPMTGFNILICIPCRFRGGASMYLFFQRSVFQILFTRPILIGLSALCDRSSLPMGAALTRLLRVLALFVLVYVVMILGRFYLCVRTSLWKAFNPVAAFMIVKGFILVITIQDFIIAMIYSKTDRFYRETQTREALRAYSLLVSIESLVYLFLIRHFVHSEVFRAYTPGATGPMSITVSAFMAEVYSVWHVLDSEMPCAPPSPEDDKPREPAGSIEVGRLGRLSDSARRKSRSKG